MHRISVRYRFLLIIIQLYNPMRDTILISICARQFDNAM